MSHETNGYATHRAPRVDFEHDEGESGVPTAAVVPAGGEDKPLEITCIPGFRGTSVVKAFHGHDIVHADSFNLAKADARKKFIRDVVQAAKRRFGVEVSAEAIEAQFLAGAAEMDAARAAGEGGEDGEPVYTMEESDDPDRAGIVRHAGGTSRRLTNFTAHITEEIAVVDDATQASSRYRGIARYAGRERSFEISSADWASDDRLRAALFGAAGSTAVFRDSRVHEVRTAISLNSTPALRTITTAHGWSADARQYLTPTGLVDEDGFRPYLPDDPIRVDVSEDEDARALGLSRLEPADLAAGRTLLVEHYLRLHHRRVMMSLLGAAALAVMERFAASPQRPAIWLKGDTGVGKSYAAKMTKNFFGDYGPGSKHRPTSWASTGNCIEKVGFFFRDAPFVVDDYKPEYIEVKVASKIVQNYADGHARGRLQSDAGFAASWPIRGLLISTGEDLPQANSASLARMVVIDVPAREAGADRRHAAACEAGRHLLRGVMADFIARVIRKGRAEKFAGVVARFRERFLEGMGGRQNADRIAGNHALLAAGVQEFARYLGGCPGAGPVDAARPAGCAGGVAGLEGPGGGLRRGGPDPGPRPHARPRPRAAGVPGVPGGVGRAHQHGGGARRGPGFLGLQERPPPDRRQAGTQGRVDRDLDGAGDGGRPGGATSPGPARAEVRCGGAPGPALRRQVPPPGRRQRDAQGLSRQQDLPAARRQRGGQGAGRAVPPRAPGAPGRPPHRPSLGSRPRSVRGNLTVPPHRPTRKTRVGQRVGRRKPRARLEFGSTVPPYHPREK